MIMGVQRSGTTALFDALSAAKGVTARIESAGDDIYDDYFLRPEPEIRGTLHALPGTVLLKPVRESEMRSPQEVAGEYAGYDLQIVWLYRDPVNVFDSYVRRGWVTSDLKSIDGFAHMWVQRNAAALASASELGDRLVVVRYEDLVSDPVHLSMCADALCISVATMFGSDSARGRTCQPEAHRTAIDGRTAWVRAELDQLRLRRSPSTALPGTPPTSLEPRRAMPPESWEAISVGGRPKLHATWRARGPLLHHKDQAIYVSLGYDASRQILACSHPTSPVPTLHAAGRDAHAVMGLEKFFADRRGDLDARIKRLVGEWSTGLPREATFDAQERLSALSVDCIAAWLAIPRYVAESFQSTMLKLAYGGSDEPWTHFGRWRDQLMARGLVAELVSAGLLQPNDVPAFICDFTMRLLAVPALVCNTMVALSGQPDVLAHARERPGAIPAMFAEAMRLAPMWFSVRRQLERSLSIAGFVMPAGSQAQVFLATANRDPAVFEDPDGWMLGRRGPSPLLSDTNAGEFSGLTDSPPWGCRHLMFDVAVMALSSLLAGPRALAFMVQPSAAILPMPYGDLLQIPGELLLRFEPRTPHA